jgi:3',5'-cyclic AMP phosphodiesterase CpdA
MKKIIHLSDLHIGFRDLEQRFQDLVANLIDRLHPAEEYVVVITGDLVEKAVGTNSYQKARDALETLEDAGFVTLPIPGNHDYNNGLLLDKCCVDDFKATFFGDPHLKYPKVDIVDGIAFLGLDSLRAELHWYDRMFADGELGEEQLARLDEALGDSHVQACEHRVIYLHHHPFDPLPFSYLKDARKLRRIIQKHNNVDALLFGHNHLGRVCNGTWGIQRCYDGGSATGKRPCTMCQRVLDLDKSIDQDYDAALLRLD